MFDSHFSTILVISQILWLLTTGWHLFLKGKKSLDNLWFFLYTIFQQLMVTTALVIYFPFHQVLFLFSFLITEVFSSMFVYSYPRSVSMNKNWYLLYAGSGLFVVLHFLYTGQAALFSYILMPLAVFVANLVFIVKKLKYLEPHRRHVVAGVTFLVTGKNLLLGIFAALSFYTFNVVYLKHFIIFIMPLYYIAFFAISVRRVSTSSRISLFLMQLFMIFSIITAFLFNELSSLRVSLISFFDISHIMVPSVITAFIFFNLAAHAILYFASLMNNYFNAKHIAYQKLGNSFRIRVEKMTSYRELFNYLDHILRSRFKDLRQVRYILFVEDERLPEISSVLSIDPIWEESKTARWFMKNREPYLVAASVNFPVELRDDFLKLESDMMVPIYVREGLYGFVVCNGKKIDSAMAGCISNIVSTAGAAFVRISLFEETVEKERQLQESRHLQEVDKMVSIIAHEIRTPLTSIMFNMDILAEGLSPEDESDKEFLDIARSELKRLNSTVEKMLLFGRKIQLNVSAGRFSSFVNELVYIFSQQSIPVTFHQQTEQTYMYDWDSLKQVVTNLVTNSLQAIEKSGKGSAVEIIIEERLSMLFISVIDDGPGIPKEHVGSIFDSFYTTRQEGNGLGLAVCRKIVKTMGGKIKLVSTSQDGTIFQLALPVERKE